MVLGNLSGRFLLGDRGNLRRNLNIHSGHSSLQLANRYGQSGNTRTQRCDGLSGFFKDVCEAVNQVISSSAPSPSTPQQGFTTNTPMPTNTPQQGFTTNTPMPTNTPQPTPTGTSTPSPTPTESETPISLSSVFGSRIAIPLPGATTAVYGAGHAAIDIVPEGSGSAAGSPVHAVCTGQIVHAGNWRALYPSLVENNETYWADYYGNVIEQLCDENLDNVIIYSHVCPLDSLSSRANSGQEIASLAGISVGSGSCVDDGSIFPFYGAAHLHFETKTRAGEPVPPTQYLLECQTNNPPSWCAVASDLDQSYLPTPTPSQ